jgi:two-component system sensor histidine kinase EvgS
MTDQPVILVVEDNRIQQRVVEMFSAKCGYQCRTVTCWPELAGLLEAEPLESFSLVLMDWHLRTDTTGLECTQQLRLMEACCGVHIPILGMTANAMEDDRDQCIAAGMDDVLTKPFMFREFKATVDAWIAPQSDFAVSTSA